MADKLIIYLKNIKTQQCDWLFVDHNNKAASPVEQGTIAELAEKNRNAINSAQQVICLLPNDYLHYSQVDIPTKNRQRVLQAIPYSLEDQLADDIDDLHFAIGQPQQGQYPVAAINKTLLDTILNLFAEHKITLSALCIRMLAFENQAHRLNILVEDDSATIAVGTKEIIEADRDNLDLMIQIIGEQQAEETAINNIQLWHHADQDIELQTPANDITVEHHSFQNSSLSDISDYLKWALELNILQGKYKPVSASNNLLLPWRAAAALFVGLLIVKLVTGIIELNNLKQENRLLDAEIESIYKRSFPGSKRIVNARVQMENKLKALRKGSSSSEQNLIDMLAAATPIFSKASNIEFESINFRNKRVEIDLLTDNISSLDDLKSRLSKLKNIKAEMLSATSADKQVKGRIRLESSQLTSKRTSKS